MIALCSPTRESFHSGFTFDLVALVQANPDTQFFVSQGTLLCNQRTTLVREALQAGASHVLFIDSDMRFPKDTVERLLAHDKDIIGANCIQRRTDVELPTAQKEGGMLFSSRNMKGIDEMDYLGFGVTLIKRAVFEKVSEPWFATPYDGTKFVGEDIFFCTKAKEAGFRVWVDHDLSQDVKHCGLKEYGYTRSNR